MKKFPLLIMLILFSCKKDDNNYTKNEALVNIIQTTIPQNGTVSNKTEIGAMAQAENGCYRDIKFKLIKVADFQYTLKAYATFESYGACPEVLVNGDTTISFIPEKKGTYQFTINEQPFNIKVETLIVN
ncbi:hypothetical protein NF867_16310 [Solitalea sp. MAHUQ-68]|uniref:Lipoprotein n=1 Tax=Solitalea agri TaxID=2953739 RepID=A0A9X2F505_9SPHI|nr:hypothetical protein [Solitalea agri]MCO4294426.1 hypothetical protein [Solitalea agri]